MRQVFVYVAALALLVSAEASAGIITVTFDTGPFSTSTYSENGMTVTGDPVFGKRPARQFAQAIEGQCQDGLPDRVLAVEAAVPARKGVANRRHREVAVLIQGARGFVHADLVAGGQLPVIEEQEEEEERRDESASNAPIQLRCRRGP